jgi:PPOX class probable F420-dependent enzyme
MKAAAETLTPEQTTFLVRRRVARLATADATGEPHVVPVCFAYAPGSVYIALDEKPKDVPPARLKRVRNILENPQAALVADHYDEDWRRLGWVMLRGRAQILETGSEHDSAQELLRARYPQYRAMDLAGLPVIALRIARATSWGDLSAR